ncbi:MAG: hypothetical protein AAGI22_16825 [Planctomycetota bacterium]
MRRASISLLGLAFVAAPLSAQEAADATDAPTKREREERAYPVTTCTLPDGVALEVGGLAIAKGPNGPRVLASTRRGELWGIDGFAGPEPSETASFELVAEGLHEPLGVLVEPDGSLLTACRGQLTRLVDADGDHVYETQECVCDWWRISGNYHEYNFGPSRAIDGSYWITTNKPFGGEPFGRVDWRGYAFRITPDGQAKPMCAGLRSPAGVHTAPWGEVFYTDNQGEWCGASKLSLLRPGSYHGHPWGLKSTRDPAWTWKEPQALTEGELFADIAESGDWPEFQMPAIWFPYDKMGRSPAGFVWDETEGAFGPFAGQLFVADQYEAAVFRVDLERVRGHWQGACFRFRDALSCGAIRLAFTPTGALLVGETDRGWGSKGSNTEGLERIDFSGRAPFEIHTMRLLPTDDGFRLRFTAPADPASLETPGAFKMESYTYVSSERYGSPELDRATHEVVGVEVHPDGYGVDLFVEDLREGYVHELDARVVRSAGGESEGEPEAGLGLLHPRGYYTLVRLP